MRPIAREKSKLNELIPPKSGPHPVAMTTITLGGVGGVWVGVTVAEDRGRTPLSDE
ncbi:MAG: hypothetical protein U0797_00495 [Gemmataceae bacterium]